MWKFQDNLLKKSAVLPYRKDFLAVLCFILAVGCAGNKAVLNPPKAGLQDPYEYSSSTASSMFRDAYRDYQQGEQANARRTFQKILNKSPNDSAANLAVGYTYLAEANTDLAEKYIQQALQSNPDYPQAHFALSEVYESRQDYDAALSELDQVATLKTEYPEIGQERNVMKLKAAEKHMNLAKQLSQSDPQAAVDHYKAVEKLAPEITQIPLEIADVYLNQNDCTSALPYLEQADQDLPGNVEVKSRLFRCYFDLQKYEPALKTYEELTVLVPPNADLQKKSQEIHKMLALRSLPDEYWNIATSEEVNRAQLAALIMTRLEFLQEYRMEESAIITDTLDHWAKPYIQQVVDLGIMDLSPNRTFAPSRSITKLELTKAASRILEILQSKKDVHLNLNASGPVPIPDIPESNVYYSMVSRTLAAGVVSLDNDGRFDPYRPVTGAEAMSMINHFLALLEPS
ncbi:MAG TPA: tetratricopeptide repeat protein [Acidobacteriota bacterium]|nr:tetratricopeptide repeat protein [Acidobacteriota bacterium]